MTATRILLLILSLCSSGRACIPTVTPDYIYDLEWQQEQERLSTSSVLLTTVMESTVASTSPASSAPTTSTATTTSSSTSTASSTSTSTSTSTTTTPLPTQCPGVGWILDMNTGVCYFANTASAQWQFAVGVCRNTPGGDLASIGSQMENDFILNNVIQTADPYYIGLQQLAGTETFSESGTISWTDGTPYDYPNGYTNWDGGPPGQTVDNECLTIYGQYGSAFDGTWASTDCTMYFGFICEVMATP